MELKILAKSRDPYYSKLPELGPQKYLPYCDLLTLVI